MFESERPSIARERTHGDVNAARAMRNAARAEPQLDTGERAEQGWVAEVAKMADAKDLVGELSEAVPQ